MLIVCGSATSWISDKLLNNKGQVDVKGGKIADVKVVKHGETEMIIAAPIEQMIPEIVKKNGVEGVDSVGGATLSSEGIKAAVKDALSKAQ